MKADKDISNPLILIADDDDSSRMLLRATITQWDYQTVEARDGQEAFDILQQPNAPEIATVDWMMPKMDGFELCERMKKLPHRPYIILLTSFHETTSPIKALDAGADDFLTKPINYAELRTRLKLGLRVIHYERRLRSLLKDSGSSTRKSTHHLKQLLNEISTVANHLTAYTHSLHETLPAADIDKELIHSSLKEIAMNQAILNQKLQDIKDELIKQDMLS